MDYNPPFTLSFSLPHDVPLPSGSEPGKLVWLFGEQGAGTPGHEKERERRVNRVFLSFHTMRNSLSITLRDLKIAKFKKRGRMLRCGPEFDAYLAAVGAHGEGKVPQSVIAALTACMGEPVNKAKGATVAYHLTKYVRR